jgi:alkylation response protein AidB-like acyl-CoA dehydrogenase
MGCPRRDVRTERGVSLELQLSDDQVLFRDTTRRFLEDSCPLTEVRRLADEPSGFDRGWWRKGAELGWTSLLVPEGRGGGSVSGDGLADLTLVAEERGRLVAPGPLGPVNVVASTLAVTDGHTEVLDSLLTGEIASWCFDEPGPAWGADAVRLEAKATDDGFVLTGTKTAVEAGAEADWLLVTARTEQGLTQFVLPAGTPGVRVSPGQGIDLVRRFATVHFDGALAPSASVVGEVGGAASDVEHQLQVAIVLQLAETVGAIGRVFEFTTEWAFDRFSFGRPLASYQELKHRFADMALWLEGARATTAGAARAVSQGTADAAELVSVAKCYVGEHAGELVQDCIQMHGGIGVTWDHDIHLYLRRVTLNSGQFGTVRNHRQRLASLVGLV